MIVPDYYGKFRCIGGECKNNCCKGGWEIEVDEEALERFKKIDGEFGQKVINSINEENLFIHKNGQCPLLTEDGWCQMAQNGHQLCVICDEYPRFTEYFEDYCERGISVSCEAAAEIILSNEEKVTLTGETGKCEAEIFTLLIHARNKIFDLLQERSIDIFKRIRLVLDYGKYLQERINNNNFEIFDYTPSDNKSERKSNLGILYMLSEREMLSDKWGVIIDKACDKEENSELPDRLDDLKGEQLAVYFVYRYFLKGAFDCDVLSKLEFMAVSVLAINSVSAVIGDLAESARLYSIEIEHDENNIEAIYDEFLFCEDLSCENIIRMLSV